MLRHAAVCRSPCAGQPACDGEVRYTVQEDPRIDAKIQGDLNLIRREILGLLGRDAKAILLAGGFGRGEGGVIVSDESVEIVNDYDIIILLEAASLWRYLRLFWKFDEPIDALASGLAQRLGLKQVDLVLRPLSYFEGPLPLAIENYEVKNGHQLLFGHKDPCDLMPDWCAEDIPLFEGTWLFRNRGLGLLIAACYLDCEGQVSQANQKNFIIECNKAQMAIGDSCLLLKQRYHWSYAERLKRIHAVSLADVPLGQAISRNYIDALENKLQPDFQRFYARDPRLWWTEIATLFDDFYRYFESRRLGVEIGDWLQYARLPKPEDKLDVRTWVGGAARSGLRMFRPSVWRLNSLRARKSNIIALVALLLFAKSDIVRRTAYLQRAAEFLGERLTGNTERDWAALTGNCLLLVHPGGEAGRVAKEDLCATVRRQSG